jgi:hypothetical protein
VVSTSGGRAAGIRRKESLSVSGPPRNSDVPPVLIIALIIAVALMLFLGLSGPDAVRF